MRWKLQIFLFFQLVSIANADSTIDSLKFVLGKTFDIEKQIPIYNQLYELYKYTSGDSSAYYARILFEKAGTIKSNYYSGIGAANLADLYIRQDNIDTALYLYKYAIEEISKTDSFFDLTQSFLILGNIYLEKSDFDNAFSAFHKGLKLGEKYGFKEIISHIYNNLGVGYLKLEDNEKALELLQKAYDHFMELNWEIEQAHTLSNISVIHEAKKNIDLAKINLYESLKIFKKYNDKTSQSRTYSSLGNIELNKKRYVSALNYFNDAKRLIIEQDTVNLGPRANILASILLGIGKCNYYLGNIPKAESFLFECFEISNATGSIGNIMNSSKELARLNEDMGRFDSSLKYFKIFKQLNDSIFNEESIKRITQLEMQYEFDKEMKEKELKQAIRAQKELRKEYVLYITIILILALAIIFILLFVNQKNKTKQQKLKQEALNIKLEHKNKELTTNVMYLLKKNEFITNIAEKLTKIKYDLKKENQKIIKDIIKELEGNTTKDSWNEFEIRFNEVHTNFYIALNDNYPSLTPNERKLCAFLRLNMSSKEISAITYQSVSSINMARFRLRKKMRIERDENLISTLSKL
ncbi:MAG: tetratricopeptide repeat protein [Bacteroidetes bacterium]|jgi:tetratricopeptide (TPR) repeat protein|nr:tetratricopeptide repeat protein [Bacteroidota bacterium]MBT6685724.1 tetratricopeptide repeat protein [Bacteroidota bacterium]MBT7143436.1 tetratricopeptide repeat protein [Bacteroidota bacterium]MBT7493113.1 tetratricopeptide repeat protein [Bacteroidota bacterium]